MATKLPNRASTKVEKPVDGASMIVDEASIAINDRGRSAVSRCSPKEAPTTAPAASYPPIALVLTVSEVAKLLWPKLKAWIRGSGEW